MARQSTKPTRPKTPKNAPVADTPRLSLLDAAVFALRDAGAPMGAKDLIARILDTGLWESRGKTPQATLYSAIIREIAKKGRQARFKRATQGRFALTAAAKDA